VCYTTTLKQTFNNPSQDTISQARYTFPLYDGVAVSGYTITYGDKTLKGIVQHKETAKKTYDDAVERGETAGLLESLPAGVFGVTLGNLPPKTDVNVDIVYCGELKHDAAIDGLRFMLPTSVAPRYGEYPGEVLESTAINKSGVSIVVDVDMDKNSIRKVQSPSHPIAVSLGATSSQDPQVAFNQSKASATLTLGTAELACDFVLQVLVDDISKPQAILEEHPDLPSRAIMATFAPKFNLETSYPEIVFIADQSGSMRGSENAALVSALKIFLKSLPVGVHFNIIAFGSSFKALWPKSKAYNEGNMKAANAFVDTFQAQYGGTEILQPVQAAFEQKLGDMPLEIMLLTDGEIWGEEQLFELIASQVGKTDADARVFTLGVGSHVSHTLVEGVARAGNGFAQFVTHGEETDRKVVRMLKGALYPHLKDQTMEINYSNHADQAGTASDDDFELVEKVDCGITIEDLTLPKSSEQTITGDNEMGENRDKTPASLYDPSADLDSPIKAGNVDSRKPLPAITVPKIIQAPNQLPSLFPFNRTTLYLLLSSDAPQKKISSITLRATSTQGLLELTIDVDNAKRRGTTIHQLAARKAIQDLEEGRGWLQTAEIDGVSLIESHNIRFNEFSEREAVRIGELYQVAGKWTSFVAVGDKGNNDSNQLDEDSEEDSKADVARPQGPRQRRAYRRTHGVAMRPATRSRGGGPTQLFSTLTSGTGPRSAYSPYSSSPCCFAASSTMTYGGGSSLNSSSPPISRKRVACEPSSAPAASFSDTIMAMEEAECEDDDEMGFGLFDDVDSDTSPTAAAAPLPPPPSLGKKNVLHELISLQTFVGAWEWNDQLFETIGKKVTFDADTFASRQAMATALAVAYLESELAAGKDVWEMVVAKARSWMASQGVGDVERAVDVAKGLL
jgi:hypothetical protein